MSLQGVTEGSDSQKSKSKTRSGVLAFFSYEHNGSLRDRLLTAFYMLAVALVLSVLSLQLPYGGLLCVAFAAAIVAMSVFEIVRLFARNAETLHYRPVAGAVMYAILALPAVVAALSAVQSVVNGVIWWRAMYGAHLMASSALMFGLALEGRFKLEGATRFGERYVVAFLIVGVCAPALIVISGLPSGLKIIWWIAACAALNDVAAYFVGRAIGRHKMAPGLSPQKSIEGSVAGMVIGSLAGLSLWSTFVGAEASSLTVLLVSFVVVLAAQSGDLAKSYLKRIRGVKDLGAILPGHGGVLDRFDAMIAAAPVTLVALGLLGMVQ